MSLCESRDVARDMARDMAREMTRGAGTGQVVRDNHELESLKSQNSS